ncbi:MAG: tyrosine-type recombinase/integrase [Coprobacillus cateniformis]|uniref:tyrosine-type recombinase/integrase n=1 Tax=Longibaculum muris TaxID=1796628 RepID=UPI003AB66129|nr:tyrosine-type recombinase/integrase [Coprobacillus cateniformis]
MKTNDFSYFIHKYLVDYLPKECGASENTIDTYRYNFIQFFYFLDSKEIKPEKIAIKDINRTLVTEYLNWLESEKNNSVSTRNCRLAVFCSFCRFLKYEYPDYIDQYIDILNIPIKKDIKENVGYLEIDGIKLLMKQPNRNIKKGNRDYLILLIMYESAMRVSEIINIKINDLHRVKPYYIKVIGKGKKTRNVPLPEKVMEEINEYIKTDNIKTKPADHLLFFNPRGESFTRAGICYILKKYCDMARNKNENLIPKKVTPHVIRHSKAMHLLQNGVNLVYIRDILGHTSIQTTEIYARADSKHRQEALSKAYQDIYPNEKAEWEDKSILDWLKRF